MSRATLLINGRRVYNDRLVKSEVLIVNGKIKEIGEHVHEPGDAERIDLNNNLITPGLIDVHVHLREPGYINKETIATGSKAAAHGGFTTIAAMANLNPTCDTPEKFKEQVNRNEKAGLVKILQYSPVTVDRAGKQPVNIVDQYQAGARLFSDDGAGIQDAGVVYQAMQQLAKVNAPLCDHAQDNQLAQNGVINDGAAIAQKLSLPGMPAISETAQIARNLVIAQATGAHYHVCHVSTKESIDLIRYAKQQGINVTCEVTPHHLLLADADIKEDDAEFKMNPPLRRRVDQQACLVGLLDGTIDCIATDHAPHTDAEKQQGFLNSPNGIVGSETAFALLYTHFVKTGIFTLAQLIDWLTAKPQAVFNLENAGLLKVGDPADIAVFDIDHQDIIRPEQFFSKGHNTPFVGDQVYGMTKKTFVDGKLVYTED
ncbi:dihydroorotase [Limosilactobacillus sp. RRLNB_1_1]|uniref:Dihydroorotase n=1 Tax=Limosilactobacillus albertensis TaxID=2759752 RepID=A0A7W3TSK4_9LACO|nr:dihydroorotase [Limosilactobacillus albertensis]MBB1070119.1 dihydroorotase [Limosilactobacillus albertensis]MCD7117734.1 dihydroorotase [Limosilactobacillus albertensis]MCD7128281.1 dihydroorotase [Limosilactobacillus albertensis]